MATTAEDQTMQNIRAFAQEVRSAATSSEPSVLSEAYEQQLDQTIKELRERVKQQRIALEQIKASGTNAGITRVSADRRKKLHQLHTVKTAFDTLAQSEPSLPRPDSALPAVLALRTLQRTVAGSKDAIATTRRDLATTNAQLRRERTSLADAHTIKAALEVRIVKLQQASADKSNIDPNDVAGELLNVRQTRKADYERDTLTLHDALLEFTRNHLGAMVAAEELGGPIVGEGVQVDDAELATGFLKGKKRTAMALDQDERQRRIDEIWGAARNGDHHSHHHGMEQSSEREAAAREVHGLIERLIQASIRATGEGVYIRPERDSAAARFLIRARVAEYHPKDARKMCLIDFGKEFD